MAKPIPTYFAVLDTNILQRGEALNPHLVGIYNKYKKGDRVKLKFFLPKPVEEEYRVHFEEFSRSALDNFKTNNRFLLKYLGVTGIPNVGITPKEIETKFQDLLRLFEATTLEIPESLGHKEMLFMAARGMPSL